jgi:hypothetical protein
MKIKDKVKEALQTPMSNTNSIQDESLPALKEAFDSIKNSNVSHTTSVILGTKVVGERHAFDVEQKEDGLFYLTIVKYSGTKSWVVSTKLLTDNRVAAMREMKNIISDKIMNKVDMNEKFLKEKT